MKQKLLCFFGKHREFVFFTHPLRHVCKGCHKTWRVL